MRRLILTLIFTVPILVSADGITNIIDTAFGIVKNILIPLAFALCLFYFFWGVAKYIGTGATSDKEVKESKRIMGWGIVGIFVAFSIWGIITFIKTELNIPPIENVDLPNIINTRIY